MSFTKALVSYNVPRLIDSIFDGCDQSVIRDVKRHMVDIDTTDKIRCNENIKRILTYIAYNGTPIRHCIIKMVYSIEKYIPISKIVSELEQDISLREQFDYSMTHGPFKALKKYFPHDDCRILLRLGARIKREDAVDC